MSWILCTYANTSRCRPSEALLDSLVAIGGDMATPKALDRYRAELWKLWTARAADVTNCCSIFMNIDGTFDRENIELVRHVYREQKAFEPWLRGMEFEATVGIVRSQNTILYRPHEDQDKVLATKIHDSQHALEFQGWVQTLVAVHPLWDSPASCVGAPGAARSIIARDCTASRTACGGWLPQKGL